MRRLSSMGLSGLAVALALSGCGGETRAARGIVVFASVPPIGCLVERIAGENATVYVMVSGGQDPHSFEPRPSQVLALSRARVYFYTHLPFETRLLEKAGKQTQRLRVVDLLKNVHRLPLVEEEDYHAHAGRGEDAHFDEHVWLGPEQLRVLAQNICDALADEDPGSAAAYRARRDAFLAELESVRTSLAEKLAPYAGRRFYVYHPAFTYFAVAFGLEQVAVESGGKSPTPKRVRALIHQALDEEVSILFVQPQIAAHAATAIAACIRGSVVSVDPLAGDVLENLRRIAAHLQAAFDAQDRSRGPHETTGGNPRA